jgi:hypothetical protein
MRFLVEQQSFHAVAIVYVFSRKSLCHNFFSSSSSPEYTAERLVEFLKDSNASAQDAATKLCLTFVSRVEAKKGGGILAEHVTPICNVLVDKGLGARPGTKKLAADCLVEFGGIDLGNQAMVCEHWFNWDGFSPLFMY